MYREHLSDALFLGLTSVFSGDLVMGFFVAALLMPNVKEFSPFLTGKQGDNSSVQSLCVLILVAFHLLCQGVNPIKRKCRS